MSVTIPEQLRNMATTFGRCAQAVDDDGGDCMISITINKLSQELRDIATEIEETVAEHNKEDLDPNHYDYYPG